MAYYSPAEVAAMQSPNASKKPVASSSTAATTAAKTLTMSQATSMLKEAGVPYGGQAGSQLKDWESIANYVGANLTTGSGSLKATASPNTTVNRSIGSNDTVKTTIVDTGGGGGGGGGSSSKSTTYAMADEQRMSGLEMDTYRNFYGKMKGGRTPQAAQLLSPYRGYGGPRSTAIGNPNVQTATKMLLGN